ncbi:MAG TPA: aspartyl/asparaginyl beta-hydroxylase domain-containing protein [Burkholderiaceae bacterium]
MHNFMMVAHSVDVMPLNLAIKRRPELWKEDTYLRDYPQGPFGEIESIMLRFPVKGVFETEEEVKNHLSKYDQHESIDYPPYKVLTEARPIVMALMARVQGERLGRVMINKIKPGGRIYPHADTKEHAEYYSRFHVVLQSQPGVFFRSGDESVYMDVGTVWWFDNKLEHEVINNSADDRIHMIVDIRTSR